MKKSKFFRMICLMISFVMIFSMSVFAVDETQIEKFNAINIASLEQQLKNEQILNEILKESNFTIDGIPVGKSFISGDVQLVSEINYFNETNKSNYCAALDIGLAFDETINSNGVVSVTPRAVNTITDSSDATYDVTITVTITWETGTILHGGVNVPYAKLTKVEAAFKPLDSQHIASNLKTRGRYSGYNLNTNQLVNYTSNWSFSTSSSISGVPLENNADGMRCWLWGDGGCTVTRGNQTWDLMFTVGYSS